MKIRTSKHVAQKVLSCALSAAMVVAFAPAVAMADGGSGDTTPSVASALTEQTLPNVQDGKITITSNGIYTLSAKVTSTIVINNGVEAVINLGGVGISVTSGDAIVNKGTLTVKGSGPVKTTASGSAAIANVPDASATLEGGAFESENWYVIKNLGTMKIDGDVSVTTNNANNPSSLIDNGWVNPSDSVAGTTYTATANKASLTVESGNFFKGKSGKSSCSVVKNDDYGVLKIHGGTFDSTNNTGTSNAATLLNWNETTITGGKFIGQYPISDGYANNGKNNGIVNISGGEFTGNDRLFGYAEGSGEGGKVSISGGTYTAPKMCDTMPYVIEISGGNYNFDIENQDKEYLTVDSIVHDVNGKYYVHNKSFSMTTTGYKAPTCTEAGESGDDYCAIDGYHCYSSTPIAAKTHTAEVVPAVAPGCTTTGLTEGSKCKDCGTVLTAQETVPATGHSAEAIPAVAPTCTETGLTEGSKCSTCGEVLKAQETVPATGHNYVWTVTTPATSEAEGVSTGVCSACKDTVTKSIPKLQSTETAVDTSTGTKVNVTIDSSEAGTTADGTSFAGTVTYNVSDSVTADTTSVEVPATVDVAGVTYVVTKIDADAFKDMTQVTEVTVPATVTEVGSGAFAGTTSLKSVTLPEGVTTVGEGAFEGSGVESVTLPSTVTEVAASTFKDCTELTTVEAPAATSIGASALAGCTSLTTVDVPAVKTIESKALAGCTSLKTVEAPAATTVAASAFKGCTSLKTVSVESAKTIGASALAGCTKLKTVTTGAKLTTIGAKAFNGNTKLKTLVISSKKLTAKSIKNALKGSSVSTVKVSIPGASKKAIAKVVNKYAKIFTKKNCGKAVKVKKA